MIQNRHNTKHHRGLPQKISATKKLTARILLAEDDDEMRKLLAQALCEDRYEVIQCHDGGEFLVRLQSFIIDKHSVDFDVIISDIRMPGLTGLEILKDLHECRGFPPMILITAFGDKETHAKAEKFGAAAIFDKPFEIDDLLAKVREIIQPQISSKE
jgi:two-component system response regulator (stage 0 sporulation protein F)